MASAIRYEDVGLTRVERGGPPMRCEIRELVVCLARDQPAVGYQRIVGEPNGLALVRLAFFINTRSMNSTVSSRARSSAMTP
jgi:hypothetical protein